MPTRIIPSGPAGHVLPPDNRGPSWAGMVLEDKPIIDATLDEGNSSRKKGSDVAAKWAGAALALALGIGLYVANVWQHKTTPEGEAFKIAARQAGDRLIAARGQQQVAQDYPADEKTQTEAASAVAEARKTVCVEVQGANGEKACVTPLPLSTKDDGKPVYVDRTPTADGYVVYLSVEESTISPEGTLSPGKRETVKLSYEPNRVDVRFTR